MKKFSFQYLKNSYSLIPTVSGVYWVYSSMSFSRLRGKTNILYIGKAKDLRRRLKTFLGFGRRNALPRFQRLKQAGIELSFSWKGCKNYNGVERAELSRFEEEHFELPPLNRQG